MINTLPKFKIKSDHPLTPSQIDVLQKVDEEMHRQKLDYFVIGATARDLLITHLHGTATGRATYDIDLAVCMQSWEEFSKLKEALVATGYFFQNPKIAHRLSYKKDAQTFEVDLMPFGGLEKDDMTIAWPPEMSIVMSVAGFAEAFSSRIEIEVNDHLVLPVASLPSLSVLKLVAWKNRGLADSKDAVDFVSIAKKYHQLGNFDRLYETEQDLMKRVDFDLEAAGIVLLGRDMFAICSDSTKAIISEIFVNLELNQRFIDQVASDALKLGDTVAVSNVEKLVDLLKSSWGIV